MDIRKLFNKIGFKIRDLVIISLLLLVIGYASISTYLNVTGEATIAKNLEQYNIYIGNLFANGVNKYNSISSDLSSFTIDITEESTTLKYDVTNNSNQYDINFGFSCSAADGSTVTPAISVPDTVKLEPQTVVEDSITVVKSGTDTVSITCVMVSSLEERATSIESTKTIFYAYDGETYDTGYKQYESTETTYGSLITPTKDEYIFTGWYRDTNYTDLVSSDTAITSNNDEILYGYFGGMEAQYISYDNSSTNLDCSTLQCAIDELAKQQ